MTESEVLELARYGAVEAATAGKCGLCGEGCAGHAVLHATVQARRIVVHAACAAPVLATAHKAAGREPMRGVSGVVCGICRRSFRHADQVVIVGREGARTAIHVRKCVRSKA